MDRELMTTTIRAALSQKAHEEAKQATRDYAPPAGEILQGLASVSVTVLSWYDQGERLTEELLAIAPCTERVPRYLPTYLAAGCGK